MTIDRNCFNLSAALINMATRAVSCDYIDVGIYNLLVRVHRNSVNVESPAVFRGVTVLV